MRTPTEIQQDLDQTADELRRQKLRTMRLFALGLLAGAAVLLVVAHALRARHPAWGYVAAFAEAAMVGAIADWFAVVALFKHPLGLPIWHTAIIPNSKDAIGRNLGAFVENHFITEEAIGSKIRQADPARCLGEWLLDPLHTAGLGQSAASVARQLIEALDHEQIRDKLRELAGQQLTEVDLSGTAGQLVDRLMQSGRHQELLDALLDGAGAYLGDTEKHPIISQFLIDSLGIENSMMKMAINAYAPRSIASLNQKLDEVRRDPAHRFRGVFDGWIGDFALRLKADPQWAEKIRRHQAELVQDTQVQGLLSGLWDGIKDKLLHDLSQDQPALLRQIQAWVQKLGQILVEKPGLRQWLNQAIEDGSVTLIRKYRGEVGRFIELQLAKWTREEMSQRIELAIGRDLQFIRINGTIVGGLVGLLIHALMQALG
ncbi:DUF445 domain-containing protein [Malikia spinosa]|uniref:DUF445 domain-containing protein n=1 Tax=Malikia spinosa TaxID=86180 RepID=A0A2S9KCM1_9BURK|nr:DUF445 domain-containing protein [Malikia spinosa]PRD68203.1 DUF445 domain-containing protein [Malikia spinosa]